MTLEAVGRGAGAVRRAQSAERAPHRQVAPEVGESKTLESNQGPEQVNVCEWRAALVVQ